MNCEELKGDPGLGKFLYMIVIHSAKMLVHSLLFGSAAGLWVQGVESSKIPGRDSLYRLRITLAL